MELFTKQGKIYVKCTPDEFIVLNRPGSLISNLHKEYPVECNWFWQLTNKDCYLILELRHAQMFAYVAVGEIKPDHYVNIDEQDRKLCGILYEYLVSADKLPKKLKNI